MGGYRIPKSKERFALEIIEPTEKFGGGSFEVSGVTLMTTERDANGMGDSATGVASFCASCGVKASKGMRRSGADGVPKMSPGSRSRYSEKGIVCRPEPTKSSERVVAVVNGNNIDHVVAGDCGGSVKAYQVHRDKFWGAIEGHT